MSLSRINFFTPSYGRGSDSAHARFQQGVEKNLDAAR
jgi:hypothetical protein